MSENKLYPFKFRSKVRVKSGFYGGFEGVVAKYHPDFNSFTVMLDYDGNIDGHGEMKFCGDELELVDNV